MTEFEWQQWIEWIAVKCAATLFELGFVQEEQPCLEYSVEWLVNRHLWDWGNLPNDLAIAQVTILGLIALDGSRKNFTFICSQDKPLKFGEDQPTEYEFG